MDASKYSRSVELLCPTCGGTSFSGDNGGEECELGCSGCGLKISKSALIEANSEHIAIHVQDVKKAIVDDLRKSVRDAFKGNKHFKVK